MRERTENKKMKMKYGNFYEFSKNIRKNKEIREGKGSWRKCEVDISKLGKVEEG